jgi:D-glycero-D-manno-heptose 1,7-bisphosphate phosphatase
MSNLKERTGTLKKKKILPEQKAIFLDRDGVINYDFGYVYKKEDFVFKKNVIKAIKYLNRKKYFVFIITNQSGIGRGYYTIKDLNKLHLWLKKFLKKRGAYIDEIFYAPYYSKSRFKSYKKDSNLRKPKTGMINRANKKWNINMKESYVIGDSIVDKNLARNAKLKYVNVTKRTDLLKVVKKICN